MNKITEEDLKFIIDNEEVIKELIRKKEQLENAFRVPKPIKIAKNINVQKRQQNVKDLEKIKTGQKLANIIESISLKELEELVSNKD